MVQKTKSTKVLASEGALNKTFRTLVRKNLTSADGSALNRGCGMLLETEYGNVARPWV